MWQNKNMIKELKRAFDIEWVESRLQMNGWTVNEMRDCYLAYCEWGQEDVDIIDVLYACISPNENAGGCFYDGLIGFFAGFKSAQNNGGGV